MVLRALICHAIGARSRGCSVTGVRFELFVTGYLCDLRTLLWLFLQYVAQFLAFMTSVTAVWAEKNVPEDIFNSKICYKYDLSAHEIKNSNCCLFERLSKVEKNGVFLFGISFFVLEIFTFVYYANEESDDVIGYTKTVQHTIKNISRNIKPVFFTLGNRTVHHKRNEMTSAMPLY